jgi:hypothetical protein
MHRNRFLFISVVGLSRERFLRVQQVSWSLLERDGMMLLERLEGMDQHLATMEL